MKTRILACLLSVLMLVSLVPVSVSAADPAWYSDDATEFTISTANELVEFAQLVNSGKTFAGKTVKLGADIDMNGVEWIPIGGMSASQAFSGTFDGQNKTIKNMSLTKTADNSARLRLGLFSQIKDATIKNLIIDNANVTAASNDARGAVLVMTANGTKNTIENITIKNSSVNVKSGATGYAAGVVGWSVSVDMKNITVDKLNLNVTASDLAEAAAALVYHDQADPQVSSIDGFNVKNVEITANGATTYVGGVAGYIRKGNQNAVGFGITNGTVDNLTIVSTATSASNVGGLIGMSYKVDPQKVDNVDITGLDIDFSGSGSKVGGVIGWDRSVSYNNTTKQGWYNDVHVTGTIDENITSGSGSEVGGFVGVSHYYPKIYTNCSADVDIVTGNRAGGFVGTPCPNGWSSQTDLYKNCTANGDVTAPVAGGFVGCAWLNNAQNSTLKLENVTATGAVKGTTYAGGLIGDASGSGGCANITIIDSVASTSVVGRDGGIGGIVGNADMGSDKTITIDNVTCSVFPAFADKPDELYPSFVKPAYIYVNVAVTPNDAAVVITDAMGDTVAAEADGKYKLVKGFPYTYSATKDDYITVSNSFVAEEETLTITLTQVHHCTPSSEWSSDETGHWYVCLGGCAEKLDFAPHDFGENEEACLDCGFANADYVAPPTFDYILFALAARYAQKYDVIVTADNATVTGDLAIKYKRNGTVDIAVADGYKLVDVIANGQSLGAVDSVTFKQVKAPQTLVVVTEKLYTNPYSDIADDNAAVQYVTENGLMTAAEEGLFAPETEATRALLAEVLYALAGKPEVDATVTVNDAEDAAILWAAANGILTPNADGLVEPDTVITLADLNAALNAYAGTTDIVYVEYDAEAAEVAAATRADLANAIYLFCTIHAEG